MMPVLIVQSSLPAAKQSLSRASVSNADFVCRCARTTPFADQKMRKIILICSILACTHFLFGEFQLSYDLTYDQELGMRHRLATYFTHLSKSWFVENVTFCSYNGDVNNNSDERVSTQYYLLNYIRNRTSITRFSESYLFSFYMEGEYNFGDNIKTNIAGLPYRYTLKDGIAAGFTGQINASIFTTDVHVDYDAKRYDYEDTDEKLSHTESDFSGTLRTGVSISQPIEVYAEVFHYDDLNESDMFDYSSLYSGVTFDKKLNYIHYLAVDAAAGYCDVDSLVPYTFRADARLTSKLIHNWMFVSRAAYNIWASNQFKEIYIGNSFGEVTLQKNLSFTPENQVNNLQVSGAYFYLSDQALLKGRLELYFGKISTEIFYGRCIGSDVPYDNSLGVEVGYQISRAFRILYSYRYKDNKIVPKTNAHSFGLDMLL